MEWIDNQSNENTGGLGKSKQESWLEINSFLKILFCVRCETANNVPLKKQIWGDIPLWKFGGLDLGGRACLEPEFFP